MPAVRARSVAADHASGTHVLCCEWQHSLGPGSSQVRPPLLSATSCTTGARLWDHTPPAFPDITPPAIPGGVLTPAHSLTTAVNPFFTKAAGTTTVALRLQAESSTTDTCGVCGARWWHGQSDAAL